MFLSLKEKSWSVLLVKGYVFNDQVRAVRCENCKSTTEVLTANYNDPNLLLYGCKDSKCRHRMLKLDFNGQNSFVENAAAKASMPGEACDGCPDATNLQVISA